MYGRLEPALGHTILQQPIESDMQRKSTRYQTVLLAGAGVTTPYSSLCVTASPM
jgi:hypothetical protein